MKVAIEDGQRAQMFFLSLNEDVFVLTYSSEFYLNFFHSSASLRGGLVNDVRASGSSIVTARTDS